MRQSIWRESRRVWVIKAAYFAATLRDAPDAGNLAPPAMAAQGTRTDETRHRDAMRRSPAPGHAPSESTPSRHARSNGEPRRNARRRNVGDTPSRDSPPGSEVSGGVSSERFRGGGAERGQVRRRSGGHRMRLSLPKELATDFALLARAFAGKKVGGGGPRPSVAVVLGAQVLPGGRASKTLEARTLHAAKIYAAGEASLLIPTGGVGEHPPSEAEVMAGILRSTGVPEEAIVLEGEALSTWDSAWLVARIAEERGIEGVLAVTDPLHAVRTVAAFREAGVKAVAEPVYSSPMWRNRGMRLGQFLRETGAILWYRTRHGVGSRSRRSSSGS